MLARTKQKGERFPAEYRSSSMERVARYIGVRHWLEALLVSTGFLLYFLVRGSVVDRAVEAFQRGVAIVRLEQALGIFWELDWQAWALQEYFWIKFFNYVYFWGHFPAIIAFGFWLYFRHRKTYTLLRDAMLISGAIALIIYNLLPVAPPRFLPQWGFVDTMALYSNYSYQAQELRPFVNPFAAVPSLHFGWVMLLGIGLIWRFRTPLWWFLGILMPLAQFFAIVITGNHFIIDAVAGALVCLAGLGLAVYMQKVGYPALERRLPAALRRVWHGSAIADRRAD